MNPFCHLNSWNSIVINLFPQYYLLIFTCLVVRAVHIEILPDMTSNSVLMAFIRFSNKFCIPAKIYSDNAPSFAQACRILNQAMVSSELRSHFERNNVTHVTVPLYASWQATYWERMIGVVKRSLYKAVGRKRFDFFRLLTLISDVQNSINSRPLTYRSSDDTSMDIVTPNSFLKVGLVDNILFGGLEGSELIQPNQKQIVSSLTKRDEILSAFNDLFYESYLLSLREGSRDVYTKEWEDRVRVNEVVLISSPVKPRPFWQLGQVVELLTGSDNKTRNVRVKRPDGSIGVHPICHLHPLEISIVPAPAVAEESKGERERPVREAAARCKERLKMCH